MDTRAALVIMFIVWCIFIGTLFFFVGTKKAHAEDYSFIELKQGVTIRNAPWGNSNWKGSCPTEVAGGHHWDYNKHYYFRAELSHTSNICEGIPFNNHDETWLDQARVTIGVRW